MRGRILRRLFVASLLLAGGCGGSPDGASKGEPAAPAHPFVVGAPPAGYRLVTAGDGNIAQEWGSDSFGTNEPFTVLARGDDVAIVSATGFEGYQGGLDQASSGYLGSSVERFEIEGRDAILTKRAGDPVELIAARGEDLAIRVRAESSTRDELETLLRATELPKERSEAPEIPDPPDGWRVVGAASADLVVALRPAVLANSDLVPGPKGSYGAGWTDGKNFVSVVSLSSSVTTLDGATGIDAPWAGMTTHEGEGSGAVLVIDRSPPPDRYTVVARDRLGAVVVVAAEGPSALGVEELVAIARSVEPADETQWSRLMDEAAGGPGLHPDEGASEVARGDIDDVGWLLQTPLPTAESPDSFVDPCLKLTTRSRVCAGSRSSGGGTEVHIAGEHDVRDEPVPMFVIVASMTPANSVRVTTKAETATADLHPIPGGGHAAVVFVAQTGWPDCRGADSGGEPTMRVELLDANGAVVSCLGP